MFRTIYQYELKYWLRQPSTYLYALIIFSIGFVTLSGMATEPPIRFNKRLINSASFLLSMTRRFMYLLFFLIPILVGQSIQRDIELNRHTILYSYPILKRDYLWGKFWSSFTMVLLLGALLGLSYFLGFQMPWTNPDSLKPSQLIVYGQVFGIFLFPNLLCLSAIVFGLTTWSRNIYVGFMGILALCLITPLINVLLAKDTELYLAVFLDPMGIKAFGYYMNNWTVKEQNTLLLPIEGVVIWNRLLWLSISGFVFWLSYRRFQFTQTLDQTTPIFSRHKAIKEEINSSIGQKNALNFSRVTKVNLPEISLNFSAIQQLKNVWKLSSFEFNFLLKSKAFIGLMIVGLVFLLLYLTTVEARGETETLPMTYLMLKLPGQFYAGFINAITFLYAGVLVHRSRMAKVHFLVDASPIPNWVLLGSKMLALVKIQILLLSLVMISGMISQAYRGFYHFEIGQYVFNLFGLHLIHFAIWAMLALFIQNLLNNPYLGFFLLLLAPVGFISLSEFGPQFLDLHFLEQNMFRYNQAPGGVFGLDYSDMDGYGPDLIPYFLYKIYWALAGIVLLFGAALMMRRGLPHSFRERLSVAKQRFTGKLAIGLFTFLGAFLSMGFAFYYESNIVKEHFSRAERQTIFGAADQKYKHYESMEQPKIVTIKINMDLFPSKRQFKAKGEYLLINKTDKVIDTLILNYLSGLHTTYTFDRSIQPISKDTIADLCHFDLVLLTEGLQPKDSLKMTFESYNHPIGWLSTNDFVKNQGTYLTDSNFPRFGNYLSFLRGMHGLGKENVRPLPSDSTMLTQSFMSIDADRVDFEAIVSTEKGQTAVSPGKLLKYWTTDNRHYFHYKTQERIGVSYLFASGEFEVVKDKFKDIDLAIYYDKDHPYNIDGMRKGIKAGLAYCTENFSPYQYQQVRLVEYAGGHSAHAYPNTLPASEGSGFIADVDERETGGVAYPFAMAVHEVAHQWWGYQVLPAGVRGSKMVTESMAQYVETMVIKKEQGMGKPANGLN